MFYFNTQKSFSSLSLILLLNQFSSLQASQKQTHQSTLYDLLDCENIKKHVVSTARSIDKRRPSLNDITDVMMTSTSWLAQEAEPPLTYIKETLASSPSWFKTEQKSSVDLFISDGFSSFNFSFQSKKEGLWGLPFG